MITIDVSNAVSFLDEQELQSAREKASVCLTKVRQGTGEGSEWLGWRRIMAEPNDAELEEIDTLASRLREELDVMIVCGIGGSYLGAKAVIEALTPFFKGDEKTEIIFAGHDISGKYLQDLIDYLEQPKPDGTLKQVGINVTSKSGSTLETAISFRVLRSWLHERFPEKASDRIICTTGPEGGKLNPLVDEHGYARFIIPDDIGGRYSVLTPVGLFPAAMAGIDIRTMYYEAVSKYEALEENADALLDYAAVRYLFEQQGKTMDVITSFEPELHALGLWLQQLFGESEGKEGKGLFPVTAQYSTDLHSLGQFMQQGARSMMETFIAIDKSKKAIQISEQEDDKDDLNYLAGKTFHEINQKALEATREAHINGDVPCVTVTLKEENAQHVGEFIYFYELFTAVYCYMIGVNPFNQPGVEDYKKGMYKLLGKQ